MLGHELMELPPGPIPGTVGDVPPFPLVAYAGVGRNQDIHIDAYLGKELLRPLQHVRVGPAFTGGCGVAKAVGVPRYLASAVYISQYLVSSSCTRPVD